MRHLDDNELVDSIDRALPHARAVHLDACPACRERADALRIDLERLRAAGEPVPEPSPLFWNHFSRRVHNAVRELPAAPERAAWYQPSYWAAAAAIVLLAAFAIGWYAQRSPGTPSTSMAAVPAESLTPPSEPWSVNTLDDDDEWALVRVLADEVAWEDAQEAGLTAGPGSAERVALELSSEERQELARLLQLQTPNS